MKRLIAIVIVLVPLRASSDTFGDLKAALARLSAKQPVHATWTTERSVKASGKFANETTARTVSAEVAHDSSGVTITIPQAVIDRVHAAPDGEDAQNLIGAIRSNSIVDALDYRDPLLDLLHHAKVAAERRTLFHGKPARLLVLNVTAPRSTRGTIQFGSVKVAEDSLSVWVADDGLPLAAERTQRTSAGFLMFHGDNAQHSSFTFTTAGDRLVLTRLETTASGSGLGQKIDEASVQTVSLH